MLILVLLFNFPVICTNILFFYAATPFKLLCNRKRERERACVYMKSCYMSLFTTTSSTSYDSFDLSVTFRSCSVGTCCNRRERVEEERKRERQLPSCAQKKRKITQLTDNVKRNNYTRTNVFKRLIRSSLEDKNKPNTLEDRRG